MDQTEQRRTRLAQLLDLAQTYQGWTRKELARALRRDPTKLIPGSGIPKLDFVVDLANVLDWSIDDVVAHLWGDRSEVATEAANENGSAFEQLDEQAREAHRTGAYQQMIELAQKAYDAAANNQERARACNREAGGWDGLGRYAKVLEAVQRGLQLPAVTGPYRRMLQSNLANAYYTLWSLVEARAIAGELVTHFGQRPPETVRDRKTQAFAHYVAGHTARRLMAVETDEAETHAETARAHLAFAERAYAQIAIEMDDPSFDGIANTCRGGLTEVDVVLEQCTAKDALEKLVAGLDNVRDTSSHLVGDRLESYGWWCIFGCNIALRWLSDEQELQQYMAVFTNKADEIAEQLDSWAMRERVFTMDHARWQRAVGCTGFEMPRVVDEDEVRIITGTMARFPRFRETGWQILHSARVVRGN